MAEALEAADLPDGRVQPGPGRPRHRRRPAGPAASTPCCSPARAPRARTSARKFADDPHVILALELGGNNPLVVWDAADAEAVAGIVIQSAFVTTGQRCSCARRLIVPEGAAGDAIIEAVAALADRLTFAPWNSDARALRRPPDLGPRRRRRAQGRCDALIAGGARVIRAVRPHRRACPTPSSRPGIIDVTGVATSRTRRSSRPSCRSTASPIFDAAIARANATRYGLSAGLVSDDPANWDRFITPHPRGRRQLQPARPPARRATCPSAASAPAATTAPAPTTPPTTAPTPWPASRPTSVSDIDG